MIKMMTRKKNTENENECVIHRDITENEAETNQDAMKKAME